MKLLFTLIIYIVTLNCCKYHQKDTSQNDITQNPKETILTSLKDSIDICPSASCTTPRHSEFDKSSIKALDSAWTIIINNNKLNNPSIKYSKSKFKEALINNKFTIDSSEKDWTYATKKSFNERWLASWQNNSNFVRLDVYRWYRGYTYSFSVTSNNFDK